MYPIPRGRNNVYVCIYIHLVGMHTLVCFYDFIFISFFSCGSNIIVADRRDLTS